MMKQSESAKTTADRSASYSKKMTEKGYKQVGFYLSPKAYASLKEMTVNERLLNNSLVGTCNRLLECFSGNEFVYEALKGRDASELSSEERQAAITKAIEYLQNLLRQVQDEVAADKHLYEMAVMESTILGVSADEFDV